MQWGDIMIEYAKIDGNMEVIGSFESDKHIKQLYNSYTVIKAMIRILWCVSPSNKKYGKLALSTISDLEKLGYKVDTSNSTQYRESLLRADKRANNIITQIRIKQKKYISDEEVNITFDALIAGLSAGLKFSVPDNITVSRYCELKKIVKSFKTAA